MAAERPLRYLSFNGVLHPEEDSLIRGGCRALQFGDGVFTTMRIREGIAENVSRHFNRLQQSCELLSLGCPSVPLEWIRSLCEKNNAFKGTWRLKWMVLGQPGMALSLPARKGDVLMMLAPHSFTQEQPFRLTVYPDPVVSPTARIKTLGGLDRLYLKEYALRNSCHDVLTTDEAACVLEGAFSNIVWVEGKTIYTPSSQQPLLWGTYLSSLLEGMRRLGYEVVEASMPLDSIGPQAQVFLCNSMMGLCPVDAIDDRRFQKDEVLTLTLRDAAESVIQHDAVDVGKLQRKPAELPDP